MFSIGTSEFVKNIRKNIIVILLIAVVYMLAIFSVSAFVEQYSMWDGINTFFDETGVIIQNAPDIPMGGRPTENSLKNDLVKVEDVVTTYRYDIRGGSSKDGNGFDFTIIAYDKDKITFIPKLIEGVWCEEYEHTEGIINIVVSDEFPKDVKVGEAFKYRNKYYRVTGIYDDIELTIAYSQQLPLESSNGNYLDYYQSMEAMNMANQAVNSQIVNVVYGSYDDIKREGMAYTTNGKLTIDYYDDISEEEMRENEIILATKYGYKMNNDATYTKPIYDYSIRLLSIKVVPMMAIFIIVFLVSSVSLINAGAVNVLREKRSYGIYFVCGNDWKKTIGITLVNWLCIIFTGMIMGISATLLLKSSGELEELAFSISPELIIVMIVITIAMLFMALILPYGMFKKLQPVNILKDNDK